MSDWMTERLGDWETRGGLGSHEPYRRVITQTRESVYPASISEAERSKKRPSHLESLFLVFHLSSSCLLLSSVRERQPSLASHGSSHQGLLYLDWPDPLPRSALRPARLAAQRHRGIMGGKEEVS